MAEPGHDKFLETIEALHEILSVREAAAAFESMWMIRRLGDRVAEIFTALQEKSFAGYTAEQKSEIITTFQQIVAVLDRDEQLFNESYQQSLLERIPGDVMQTAIIGLFNQRVIGFSALRELFSDLESEDEAQRFDGARHTLTSAATLLILKKKHAIGQLVKPEVISNLSAPSSTYAGYDSRETDEKTDLSEQKPTRLLPLNIPARYIRFLREVPSVDGKETEVLLFDNLRELTFVTPTQTMDAMSLWEEYAGVPAPRPGYTYTPYVVEPYGRVLRSLGTVEDRNRILAYQAAISDARIGGALIVIEGRVNADFLRWILGTKTGEFGPAPDVEICYQLPLPSGAQCRLPIKLPRDARKSTLYEPPYGFSDPRDRAFLHKVRQLLFDREDRDAFIDLLSWDHIPVAKTVDEARVQGSQLMLERISSARLRDASQQQESRSKIFDDTYLRSEAIGDELRKGVREAILQTNRGKDVFSRQDVTDAVKGRIIEACSARILQIRKLEDGSVQALLAGTWSDTRALLGYGSWYDHEAFPEEGFPVPLYYIISDVLALFYKQESKKIKVAEMSFDQEYADPRLEFQDLDDLRAYLADPKRDFSDRTIETFTPKKTGNPLQTSLHVSHEKAERIYRSIHEENLRRVQRFFVAIEKEFQDLQLQAGTAEMTKDQTKRLVLLRGMLTRLQRHSNEISQLQQRIQLLKARSPESADSALGELQQLYQMCIYSPEIWDSFALRVTKDIKTNQVRLMYVILRDGTFLCNLRKGSTGLPSRVNHPDIAGGRNVYAAGEIVLEKVGPNSWRVLEINNGSGHYRPDGRTLYYVAKIVEQAGFDVSAARKIDSVLRVDVETGYRLRPDQVIPLSTPE